MTATLGVNVSYPIDSLQLASMISAGWTHFELYYANNPEGPFVTTGLRDALVSGTLTYTFAFTTGNASQWGKVLLWDGTNNSPLSDSYAFPFAGAITLKVLRQRTGKMLSDLKAGTTTAAGNTVTAKCNQIGFARYPTDYFVGKFWHTISNGEQSIITADVLTTGEHVFTLSPAVTSVSSGFDFEVTTRWMRDEYRDSINWALEYAYPTLSQSIVSTDILSADEIYSYQVPGHIRKVNRFEIESSLNTSSTDPASYGQPWREVPFTPQRNGNQLTLEFKRPLMSSTVQATSTEARRCRITGTGPLSLLYNDTDSVEITSPQADLVCYLAAHRLYSLLPNDAASSDRDFYQDQAKYYMSLYQGKKVDHGSPKEPVHTWQKQTLWRTITSAS